MLETHCPNPLTIRNVPTIPYWYILYHIFSLLDPPSLTFINSFYLKFCLTKWPKKGPYLHSSLPLQFLGKEYGKTGLQLKYEKRQSITWNKTCCWMAQKATRSKKKLFKELKLSIDLNQRYHQKIDSVNCKIFPRQMLKNYFSNCHLICHLNKLGLSNSRELQVHVYGDKLLWITFQMNQVCASFELFVSKVVFGRSNRANVAWIWDLALSMVFMVR